MVGATTKKLLLGALVFAFATQTWLVYTDRREPPLDEAALRGRAIWHREACQVCHQVYGQGGFLGPDLTNAASRIDRRRLASLLTVGSGQMPALHLSEPEVDAVWAYLRALDRPDLGRGQLRLGRADAAAADPWSPVLAAARAADDEAVRTGAEAFAARACRGCHLPLRASPAGAPDLSTVVGRLSVDDLDAVLREGRPAKGMPPPTPAFDEGEREAVKAFFAWMDAERSRLRSALDAAAEARAPLSLARLPWWEFR
ncbi:MAG: cytochrome c [Gemmatimonadetes bacterium]|nr:MAG: cytochrome c [Gemmatimonadota bacterium]